MSVAGANKVEGILSGCLGTNAILASIKHGIAEGQTKHFETAILILNITQLSHFLASLGAQEKLIAHQCCDQLTAVKQGIRWSVSPDRIAGSGVEQSRSSIFLKLSAD